MEFETQMTNEDETVGMMTVSDIPEDSVETEFQVSKLKEAIEYAESLGWDRVEITVVDDHPLLLKPEESETRLSVAPCLPEED